MRAPCRLQPVLLAVLVFPAAGAFAGDGPVDLYEKASGAVVGIDAWTDTAGQDRPGAFGTGVFIDPSGLVLTSITVVPDDSKAIRLYLKGGRILEARKVLSIPDMEMVLIRASPSEAGRPFPFLRLGRSAGLRVGQLTFALGNGFRSIVEDDQVSLTAGTISGNYVLQEKRSESRYIGPALETTSAVNDGMDGGPLVNSLGEVVGILSLNFSRERWLGTAIPIDVLKPHLAGELGWFGDRLERTPAYIGLELSSGAVADPAQGAAQRRPVVSEVEAGGPAQRGGIRRGDRIVSLGGDAIGSAGDFRSLFQRARPGERLKLGIERNGERREVEVTLWGRF